tara:strand:+ start:153 stop:260 length:108 start_codon:yes stop_codon:yes gene_type:complete
MLVVLVTQIAREMALGLFVVMAKLAQSLNPVTMVI